MGDSSSCILFVYLFVLVEPAPEAAHRGGAEAAEQLEEEEFGASHGGGGGGREQQLHSQFPVPEARRAAEQVGGSAGSRVVTNRDESNKD